MMLITEKTKKIAHEYLKGFGFDDDKVEITVSKGIDELDKIFAQLKNEINQKDIDTEEVDNILHSIKGVLFQLGNAEDGAFIDQLRSELNDSNIIEKIENFIK